MSPPVLFTFDVAGSCFLSLIDHMVILAICVVHEVLNFLPVDGQFAELSREGCTRLSPAKSYAF